MTGPPPGRRGGDDPAARARWRRVARALDATLDAEPARRPEALDRACAGDEELRREVEALLDSDERAGGFMSASAGELAPELLDDLASAPRGKPASVTLDAPAAPTLDEGPAPAGDPMIGRRLGPYEVVGRIGAGGMGVVYEGRDTRLDRAVALKLLPEAWSRDPQARSRLLREAKAASALDHPNICALYDLGETADGRIYLVLGYYVGTTVARRIEAGPLPVAEAVDVAVQTARGLRHAHAAGVVHRDVKPSNLLLTRSGEVKILDFGIAKVAEATGLTVGMYSPGTPAYMAPEQVRGEPADERVDVWALGAVLYEMLTGRQPFGGESVQTQIYALLNREAEPLRELRPEVPDALARIVERALEKDADARYPSVAAMLADLAPGEAGGTFTSAASTGRVRPPPAGTRRRLAIAASAAGLVLLALAGLAVYRASEAPRDRRAAAAPASPLPDVGPVEHYRAGRELLGHGYRRDAAERAAQRFRAALEQDPEYAAAHAGLAEAYLWRFSREREPLLRDRALEAADLAVRIDPQLAAARIARASALRSLGQRDEALAEAEAALRLDPLSVEAHLSRGVTLLYLGRTDEAATALDRAIELGPDDWHPLEWRGVVAFGRANYAEAESFLRRAAELAPDYTSIYKNLSAALYKQGKVDEAAAALQDALEIEPQGSIYTNLGTLQFFLGRYEASVASFERAIELGANDYLNWANLADAFRWTERPERAAEAYRRAIQLARRELAAAPEDATLASRLALFLAKTGDVREALELLSGLPAGAFDDPTVAFRRLVVLELAGERDEALEALDRALAAGQPLDEIRREPELSDLRRDPRYHLRVAPYEPEP